MAELADEWPSLAPIRTARSRSCCYYYEPTTAHTHNSISSSCSPPLSLPHIKAADHHPHSLQSPSSSSSSHVSFLQSSASLNHKNHSLLAKCFAPRPSHGFLKRGVSASPRQDVRKVHLGSGRIFRSVASFPGQDSRLGSSTTGGVAGTPPHSGPLKPGYSNSSRGHLANMNAFTMIPANVVGKKKPPEYLSDEPTSPEVTCIGRVKKSKPSKSTWDALLNGSEKLCKKKKAVRKQIEYHAARRKVDQGLQLAYIPRPLSSEPASKWKKLVSLFREIKGLHSPLYGQRKLRKEDLVIDLSQLHGAVCGAENRSLNERDKRRNAGNEVLCICQAGQAGEEDSRSTISQEEGGNDLEHAEMPPTHPNYKLLMRNMSGRSKVFHNHDDNCSSGSSSDGASRAGDPAVKIISPTLGECQMKWNKKQGFSLWKSKKLLTKKI